VKNEGSSKGIVNTLKNDAPVVGKRIAARQLAKLVRMGIVQLFTKGLKGKAKNTMTENLERFFESEHGLTFVKFLAGLAIPLAVPSLPLSDAHKRGVLAVTDELRIDAQVDVGNMVADSLTSMLPLLMEALKGLSFEDESDSPEVRVNALESGAIPAATHNAEHDVPALKQSLRAAG
jgi:hypothetical protein